MRRSGGHRSDEPGLFDFPMDAPASPPERVQAPRATAARPAAPTVATVVHPPATEPEARPRPVGLPRAEAAPAARSSESQPAPLLHRAIAGCADLAAIASALLAAAVGARAIGHDGPWAWPPLALFLLAFSFLYATVPLAFWGQTPGMAWRGLVAKSVDGDGLTFPQTFRRWLGGVLTVAIGGLPLLLALSGRSFADRLSGSRTYAPPSPGSD